MLERLATWPLHLKTSGEYWKGLCGEEGVGQKWRTILQVKDRLRIRAEHRNPHKLEDPNALQTTDSVVQNLESYEI